MTMRMTPAGTLISSRRAVTPKRFRTASKAKLLFDDERSCFSEASSAFYPSADRNSFNIPHLNQKKDDESNMLHYLNNRGYQLERHNLIHSKDSSMPESWSVKLPAYHKAQAEAGKSSRASSPKRTPPRSFKHSTPRSIFRGNLSGVSSAAVNSFLENADEQDDGNRFFTIHEKSEKKKIRPLRFLF